LIFDNLGSLFMAMNNQIPLILEKTLTASDRPDDVYNALLPVLGEVLQCDRCFLYLRNPETRMGRVPFPTMML
jgi:hypothetical protein